VQTWENSKGINPKNSGAFEGSKILELTGRQFTSYKNNLFLKVKLGGDLNTHHTPWVGNLNFQKVKYPPSPGRGTSRA